MVILTKPAGFPSYQGGENLYQIFLNMSTHYRNDGQDGQTDKAKYISLHLVKLLMYHVDKKTTHCLVLCSLTSKKLKVVV